MSDRTYAETQGEAPFDWWKALNNPTQYDHAFLLALSADWVTCACGNQCAIIPRHEVIKDDFGHIGGMPLDGQLTYLGGRFPAEIDAEDWDAAKETLRRIEARSAILIAEELAKLNAVTEGANA